MRPSERSPSTPALPVPPTWPAPADVAASDPASTGLMQGFPPAPAMRVNAQNWIGFPQSRWAVRNSSVFMPTAGVRRGGPVAPLPMALMDLGATPFTDPQGQLRTLDEFLACGYVDGFLVLHRGQVVYEKYPGSMQAWELHTLASVTKSVTALLALMLAHEGQLHLGDALSRYVPELASTPVGDASVQQNLDMAVAIDFPQDQPYNFGYWAAAGGSAQAPGSPGTVYDFIRQVGTPGAATGAVMQYQNSSPEALNWALQRVTGQSWQALLEEKIWSKLGADRDAYTVVDRAGMALAAGGLHVTLRDMARLGAMLCAGGYFNGQQIVPRAVVGQLFAPGDNHAAFASGNMAAKSAASGVRYTYHNYWYQTNGDCPAFQAHGILSQYLHIAPEDDLVIVQLASTAFEGGINLPSFNRAALALTRALRQRPAA